MYGVGVPATGSAVGALILGIWVSSYVLAFAAAAMILIGFIMMAVRHRRLAGKRP